MMVEHPEQALEGFVSRLAEPDRRLMEDPEVRRLALEDVTEAMRSGSEGFFEERMAGYVLDRGFELADVEVPVTGFHGSEDNWIPVDVGREMARRLPDGKLRETDGIAHFPPRSVQTEILAALASEPMH